MRHFSVSQTLRVKQRAPYVTSGFVFIDFANLILAFSLPNRRHRVKFDLEPLQMFEIDMNEVGEVGFRSADVDRIHANPRNWIPWYSR